MKINGIGGPSFVTGNSKSNKVSAYEKYSVTTGGDEISLSDEAIGFSRVFSAAKQNAEVREADVKLRIETIRAQLESGTYNVSSDELADSILGELYF